MSVLCALASVMAAFVVPYGILAVVPALVIIGVSLAGISYSYVRSKEALFGMALNGVVMLLWGLWLFIDGLPAS